MNQNQYALLKKLVFVTSNDFSDVLAEMDIVLAKQNNGVYNVSIRNTQNEITYCFAEQSAYRKMVMFMLEKQMNFSTDNSERVTYPYHIVINKGSFKTNYSNETINQAIELIKELKNIVVKAQDYETAAMLRDLEKRFTTKMNEDFPKQTS